MNALAYRLAPLLVLLAISHSPGADLMLRERATQHGSVIRLGDIANISATSPAELHELASTALLPAPAPGTRQFLTAAEVREFLVARGMPASEWRLNGAEVVEIGTATLPPKNVVQPTPAQPSLPEVERRVAQAIERHLHHAAGNSRWQVEVALGKQQLLEIAGLSGELQVRSQSEPRSGRERFFLGTGRNHQEIAIAADVTRHQPAVVAKHRIERGQLVRAADIEIREQTGNLPSAALVDLQQVVGKEALRSLRPDEIIQTNHIRPALEVRRGETVHVYVRTGGVTVRTRAIAKENGARGELVTLETLESKKRLDASVSGPGEVTIYATGGRATDYASLNRHTQQRR